MLYSTLLIAHAWAEEPPTPSQMVGHFEAATHVMLAVGTGEMKDARRIAKEIAKHPSVPQPLEIAARAVADCRKVDCAGPAVAEMGRTCARCHVSTGHGPEVGPIESVPGRNQRERHSFAALFVWIGLVTPQEQAWTIGVQGAVPPIDLDSDDRLRELEARFGKLVEDAVAEPEWDQRAESFGQMLTLCAECHERAGLTR